MKLKDYNFSEPFLVDVDMDLEEIFPRFLSNTSDNVEKLKDFLASSNFEELKRLCHTLKGVCGGYGLQELSEIALLMETASLAKNSTDLELGIQLMSDYLENLKVNYIEEAI